MNPQEKEHHTKKKCHLTFRTHRWEAEQDQLESKEETKQEGQPAAPGLTHPCQLVKSSDRTGQQLKLEVSPPKASHQPG